MFAIDCDEVMRQTLDAMVTLYNKHFNGNKTRDDVKDFVCERSFPDIQPATGMTAGQWFFQEHSKELFLETNPFPHVKEDIDRLRKYGKVVIVTYQKSYLNKLDTLKWLEFQGIECDGICFLKDKTLFQADYLVDDNDWNFRGNNVKHAVVVNAPYNENVSDEEISKSSPHIKTINRVNSLHEFVDRFEEAVQELDYIKNNNVLYVERTLKKQIPYRDSTIYAKEHVFGHVGDKVKIVNTYVEGLKAYVTLNYCNTWGGISLEAKNLGEYL